MGKKWQQKISSKDDMSEEGLGLKGINFQVSSYRSSLEKATQSHQGKISEHFRN